MRLVASLIHAVVSVVQELRPAFRSLLRAPTVSLSATLCLALGLGVTAAISSAIDRAMLQPLPFPDGSGLVTVYRTTPQSQTYPFSAPNFNDLARGSRLVPMMAAITTGSALVTLPDHAIKVSRNRATSNVFATLRVRALHGRLLVPADESPSASRVVVLSEEFWRSTLGGDPNIVSRTVQLDGVAVTVAGILPNDFRIPNGTRMLTADVWEPMRFTENELAQRRSNFLYVMGRLAPGATAAGAERELVSLFNDISTTYPDLKGESVRALPMQAESLASVRRPLLLLFGAVCMVLLIASTNVASLLLARGVRRQRELAVRTALGATRWDVMRPVLAESVLLATFGVTVGLLLARIGVRTIGALAAERIPQLAGLTVDGRIVAFALVLALVVSVLCGVIPAWQGAKADPQDALRSGRGGGAGRTHHRALGVLVVAQVAMSLVLLIGAGLVLKGFTTLLGNDPGFEPSRLLSLEVRISPQQYTGQSTVKRFLEPALAAVQAIPGVSGAGAISLLPYRDWGWNFNVRYEGQPGDNPTKMPLVDNRIVTPGFFAATGQRLLRGRLLRESDDDRPEAAAVVVANEALAKRDFPGQDPVGKRFHTGDTTFATIVGVVSNIKNEGPVREPQPEVYWSYRQNGSNSSGFSVLVRADRVPPASLGSAVQSAIRSVDRGAAITRVMPMPDVISASVGRPRFLFALIAVFAVVAMVLAMAGLYGVMSYSVAQRTREIGIRSALGSTARHTVWLVARQGMVLVGIGSVAGLLIGRATTRLLESLLYGVSPLDVTTWLAALFALAAAGLVATVVPSLRAARVDPLVAMRVE